MREHHDQGVTMTRLTSIAAAALLCLVPAVTRAAPSTQPAGLEKENAALKERIAALEARVKTLERQLRDARAGNTLQIIPTPAPRARPFPDMPGIHIQPDRLQSPREGWEQRDINGIRFYLVPLKNGTLAPSE
jgi:cell division protein FtsB